MNNETVLTEFTESFSKSMGEWMEQQELIVSFSGYYLLPNGTEMSIIDKISIEKIKSSYVGESGTLTIITMELDVRNERKMLL